MARARVQQLIRRQTVMIIFDRIKAIFFDRIKAVFSHQPGEDPGPDGPPGEADDRDAGKPVRLKRGPPDHGSSVAVAEPDDDN